MIKGLIFDLDGTLIDSIGDIHYSVNLAFKEYGYDEVSFDFVKLNTGRGFRKLIQDCLPQIIDEKLIDDITATYTEYYGQHCGERTKPYEGIHDTLKKLQELNIKLAVNSNKKDVYTKQLMKTIFPDINFICVYGERDGVKNKPNPETANEIVLKMGLNKNEVLYVGDSEVDIKTAKNGGFRSIGCKWGFRGEDILIKEGATYIIDKPIEMVEIVNHE